MKSALLVLCDPRGLSFRPDEYLQHASIDLAIAVQSKDGRNLGLEHKAVAFDLTHAEYQASFKSGLPITKDILVKDGASELRIVVVDRASGAPGSVAVRLSEIK